MDVLTTIRKRTPSLIIPLMAGLCVYAAGYSLSAFFGPRIVIDIPHDTNKNSWNTYWGTGARGASLDPVYGRLPTNIPGPADEWARRGAHQIDFRLAVPAGRYRLRMFSFDQHDKFPPTLRIDVDGEPVFQTRTPKGRGVGESGGDLPAEKVVDVAFDLAGGAHQLSVINAEGSWLSPASLGMEAVDGAQFQWAWYVRRFQAMPGAHTVSLLLFLVTAGFLSQRAYLRLTAKAGPVATSLKGLASDTTISALIFALSYMLAVWYLDAWKGTPSYYQNNFGDALLWACGQGFRSPDLMAMPDLRQFISGVTQTYSCSDLPTPVPTVETWAFTQLHLYLIYAHGILWRLFGTTWTAIYPLYGLMFGLTNMMAYLLFRFGAGKTIALLGTLWIALSPVHFQILPHLRDYSKAPFLLMAVGLLLLIATRRYAWGRLVALSIALGAVTGVGLGFRADLLILAPFATIVIFLLQPGFDRKRLAVKGGAVAAMLVVMYAIAFPMFNVTARNNSHAIIMGMGQGFNPLLRVEPPSTYRTNCCYHDQYTLTLVNEYTYFNRGTAPFTPLITFNTKEYETQGRRFILDAVTTFPADMLIRIVAAIRNVADLPFDPSSDLPPGEAFRGVSGAEGAYQWLYENVKQPLYGYGFLFVATTLFWLSLFHPRLALVAFCFFGFFSSYPALQYFTRHVFHLEIITLFCVALIGHAGWRLARGEYRPWQSVAGREMATGAALFVGFLLLAGTTLTMVRAYQQNHLEKLFESYASSPLSAPLVPLEAKPLPETDLSLVPLPTLTDWHVTGFDAKYLHATIDHNACPGAKRWIRVVYAPSGYDFSEEIGVDESGDKGVSRFYFPVSTSMFDQFVGVAVSSDAVACLSVRVVEERPGLPLSVYLPPDWAEKPLYQTLVFDDDR